MNCKHCGSEIDDRAKFCPECGEPTSPDGEEQDAYHRDQGKETFKDDFHSEESFDEEVFSFGSTLDRLMEDEEYEIRTAMELHGLSMSKGPVGPLGLNSTLLKVGIFVLTFLTTVLNNISTPLDSASRAGSVVGAAIAIGISYLMFSSSYNKASLETGIKLPDVPRKKIIWLMIGLFAVWNVISGLLDILKIPFIGWFISIASFVLGFYLIYKIKDIVAGILIPLVSQAEGRLAFGSAFRKRYITIAVIIFAIVFILVIGGIILFSMSFQDIQYEFNNIL